MNNSTSIYQLKLNGGRCT